MEEIDSASELVLSHMRLVNCSPSDLTFPADRGLTQLFRAHRCPYRTQRSRSSSTGFPVRRQLKMDCVMELGAGLGGSDTGQQYGHC